MKNKKLLAIMLVFCMLFSLAACGGSSDNSGNDAASDGAEQETYSLDLNIHTALGTLYGTLYEEYAQAVYEASDGRLEIVVRPAGELPYDTTEYLKVCGDGLIDMVGAHAGYIGGDCKLATLTTMPFLCATADEFIEATNLLMPETQEQFNSFNTTALFFWLDSPQRLWGQGETPASWADFQGMKMRTYSAEQQFFANEIGAIPVSMSINEVPSAIQRGVVSSLCTGAVYASDNKYSDFLDWGFPVVFNMSGIWVLINNDVFNGLPEDLQQILTEQSAIAHQNFVDVIQGNDDESIENLVAGGVEIAEISDEIITEGAAHMYTFWDEWATTNGLEAEMAKVRELLDI